MYVLLPSKFLFCSTLPISERNDSAQNVNQAESLNSEKICGIVDSIVIESNKLSFRGHKTDIKQAPWHVGVYANNTDYSNSFEQICGGSIIHSNIILSAAHCFWDVAKNKPYESSNFLIGAGKTFRSYDTTDEYENYAEVFKIFVQSNYQHSPILNDIAVIILDHHLKFSSYIKPICVKWKTYFNYNNFPNTNGYLVGWGATSQDDEFSNELMRVNLTILTNSECRKKVPPNFRTDVSNDKFCATNELKSAACRGDSGGGFAVLGSNYSDDIGRFYLTGIVSVGIGQFTNYCSEGFITLFQNLQYSQDFIKQIISIYRISK